MSRFTRPKNLTYQENSKRNALKLIKWLQKRKLLKKKTSQMHYVPSGYETEKEDEQWRSICLVRNT